MADPAADPLVALPFWEELSTHAWFHPSVNGTITFAVMVVIYIGLRTALNTLLKHAKEMEQHRVPITRMLNWLYLPITVLVVLQQVGIDLGSLWTVVSAGLAMVAIGFVAVWSMLSNVSATVMIFTTGLFKVGDELEVLEPTAKEGLRGKVTDVNLLFTTLQQQAHNGIGYIFLRVPNNIFFQKALRIRRGGAELPPPPEAVSTNKEDTDAAEKQDDK